MKSDFKILSCFKESVFLILFFILVTNIYSSVSFIFPWIYKYVYENYMPSLNQKIFQKILFFIICIFIIRILSTYLKQIFEIKIKIKFNKIISLTLLEKLMQYEYSYFKERKGGEIVSNLISEVNISSNVLLNICKICIYFLQILLFFIILFIIDWNIFVLFISIFFLVSVISLFFFKSIAKNSIKLSKIREKFYTHFYFIFNAIRDVKYYNLYGFQKKIIHNLSNDSKKYNIGGLFNLTFLNIIITFFFSLGGLIVFIIGFYKIKSGVYTFGMLLTILLFSGTLINPLIDLFKSSSVIQQGWISIKKIKSAFTSSKESKYGIDIEKIKNFIQISDLSFSHDEDNLLLNNINIKFKRNSFITIIGETGSGKSTLANLLLKLYHIPDSNIFLDYNELNKIEIKNLRKKIRIVSQDGFILDDTLKNNIDLKQSLSDACIEQICKDFELSDLIDKLPEGIHSAISENSKNISGGEKQRILIARCFAKKSNVIILDEATSAIDYITEKRIINKLLNWKKKEKDNFIISITHRPSFSKYSDFIYVLDKGKIIEMGTHNELLELKQKYYSFYTNWNLKNDKK